MAQGRARRAQGAPSSLRTAPDRRTAAAARRVRCLNTVDTVMPPCGGSGLMHDTLWLRNEGQPWPIRGRWTDFHDAVDLGGGRGSARPAAHLPAAAPRRTRHPQAARLPRPRRRHPAARPRRPRAGRRPAARRARARPVAVRQPYDRRRGLRGAARRGLPGVPPGGGQLDRRACREPAARPRPRTAAARGRSAR